MARLHGASFRPWVTATLVVLFLTLTPPAAAQGGYPGCLESPETCDPVTVNGGVKTGDQPVTILLYAHVFDLLQRSPLNTQAPDPANESDLDGGFLNPTVFVDDEAAPCCKFKTNDFVLFHSPGLVEHIGDGKWRVQQEPQLDASVHLVDDIVGYAYFSADSAPDAVPTESAGLGSPVGVVPAFGVYMRLETGRQAGQGTLIAEGDTGLGYGSPDPERAESTTTMISRPGQDTVYEFVVRLPVKHPVIEDSGGPRGFVVSMVPYQLDVDDTGEVTTADWRLRTGSEYPLRIHMTAEPTLHDAGARVHDVDGELWFRWGVVSSLGYYDIDGDTARFSMTGPVADDGSAPEVATTLRHVRFPYNAHGNVEPLNFSWVPTEPLVNLADGEYRVSASVMNLQGTYRLERNATILVEGGVPRLASEGETLAAEGDASAPMLAAVGAAVLVGLLAARTRRRSGKP